MTKNAFIAITGRPNAGKSTLTNFLVGEKISIVSPKPQTTRNRINGVLTQGDTQFVFIDTPGFMKPKNKLNERMMKTIHTSVEDVDCAVLVTDVTKHITPPEEELINSFAVTGTRVVLLLNKIDLLDSPNEALPIIESYSKLYDFEEIIPVSVKKKMNVEKIMPALEKFAVEGEHYFPDDIATDRTERFLCGELIREKLLLTMRDEIPHGTAVEIEEFRSRQKKNAEIIDIGAVIICEKDSHKGMIIGKGGERIKQIGTLARKDIEKLLGVKANIQIFVKVRENWRENEKFILDNRITDE